MQFITNGPEIPEALLEAHEDGRVVFFCGAGISYPAGLPDFAGLVKEIYKNTGTVPSDIEKKALCDSRFDAVLDLLEHRIQGQRSAVRTALFESLKPKWRKVGATDTHSALLSLSRARDGAHRLVTTNFDRVFERAAKRSRQPFQSYVAPMLPVPKKSRWNGVVYLHGQLPEKLDAGVLNRLVVTSGDFGLSYLTERWAARFVGELFRNFVVCFVGYSINDPVLRYMMDALAADRMLGEFTPEAYAFGSYKPGKIESETEEWKAKGVNPILYEVPAKSRDHSKLHDTLKAWGATYRDGVLGKELIVAQHALARPSASTKEDNFVGRMLWALSDESSVPARRFADNDPVPPLEWLTSLTDRHLEHADLSRYGITPRGHHPIKFSVAHRPSPYLLAPWMSLLDAAADERRWDGVMFELARWLTRHLDNPELIIWIVKNGASLHPAWKRMVRSALQDRRKTIAGAAGTATAVDSGTAALAEHMNVLWRVILAGHVKARVDTSNIYGWLDDLQADGLSPSLRLELRELLKPKLVLKEPFRKFIWDDTEERLPRIRDLVDWDLELASDHARSAIADVASKKWQEALPELIDDLQQLLRDALDLQKEMLEASTRFDLSHWHLPSISNHWQNRGYYEWVLIIELLRDAWSTTKVIDPARATAIARSWPRERYPVFMRLALFAATQDQSLSDAEWLSWLLADDAYWLWAVDTTRETMRVLVLRGQGLADLDKARLEAAILAGPPRARFQDDLEDDNWSYRVNREVWLRLAKLQQSGLPLGPIAAQRFLALGAHNPEWVLSPHEREEFTHWMSGTGDPDYDNFKRFEAAPRKLSELVEWLRKAKTGDAYRSEDDWQKLCREKFFLSFAALVRLAQEGVWPVNRWREALQAWSVETQTGRSLRYIAPALEAMPQEQFEACARTIAWWLEATSKVADQKSPAIVPLCARILQAPIEAGSGMTTQGGVPLDRPVTEAINHPVGHVAQALFTTWFARNPGDGDLLPDDLRPLLTLLCDVGVERFRHGRVILAANLIALFRVDPEWTKENLLPKLDWATNAAEAKSCWEGFLWSPRLYRPLLIEFKRAFLDTANHHAELGEHRHQYASLLTYAALNNVERYTSEDFRVAVSRLPQDGLRVVARSMQQAMAGAGDQRSDFWHNRIAPFWQDVWPKNRTLASPQIADALALMCIAASESFKEAFDTVANWMRPIDHPDHIVERLSASGLCRAYPLECLRLLRSILSEDGRQWLPTRLRDCVHAIISAKPDLDHDPDYQWLTVLLRAHGQG